MTAAQFKLNKLIAFTDYNKMQIDGYTNEVISIDDLGEKWNSFGWNTYRINGHDFEELTLTRRLTEHGKAATSPV